MYVILFHVEDTKSGNRNLRIYVSTLNGKNLIPDYRDLTYSSHNQ